jgi:hypothetical protein
MVEQVASGNATAFLCFAGYAENQVSTNPFWMCRSRDKAVQFTPLLKFWIVRVLVAHPFIHERTRDITLPRMGVVRVLLHRSRQVTVGSRRFPVAEIPEPNAKTNKAVEPTAIRWLFDYF